MITSKVLLANKIAKRQPELGAVAVADLNGIEMGVLDDGTAFLV